MMPIDPVMNIVSRMIESRAISFANYANRTQVDIDEAISALGDVDIDAVISETRIITSLVDAYQNRVESQIKDIINQLAEMGFSDKVYSNADEGERFEWVLGKNHRHCPDCADRAGRIETMKTWNAIGRPDAGATLCGGYCHCSLIKVE